MVGTYFGINGKRMSIPNTLVVKLGLYATTPLRKICLGKTLRITRVNKVLRVPKIVENCYISDNKDDLLQFLLFVTNSECKFKN